MVKTVVDRLLSVKSIMTITFTFVFAWLSLNGAVTADQFLTVFTVIVGFYFGTQSERKENAEWKH